MPELTVVEVPQWQGSSSATAPRLAKGAALLTAMIPQAQHLRVDLGHSLAETATRTRAAISTAQGRFVVTVGGDCGIELAPISAALHRHGDRLAVVWFDAHADLNTPATSPSGAFHGMVLRTLLGEGPQDLLPDHALNPRQVFLAGVRALDHAESDFVTAHGITDPSGLPENAAVYIHIDLDVLEPRTFGSVGTPEPDGLLPTELIDQVATLAERFEIVGLGLTEYEPAHHRAPPRDHDLLTTLIPELVELCRASTARQIERRAACAWPTSIVKEHQGWLLRHSPGVTRRRWNSALPPIHDATDLHQVETFYREHGEPTRVQVSPAEHHHRLDALLADRGYRLDGKTAVLTASTDHVIAATTSTITITVETLTDRDTWPHIFATLDHHPDSARVATDLIAPAAAPAALVTTSHDGHITGMGFIVADSGWAGIFSMATHPGHRRQGIATALLQAAARWAARHGADRLYLQVEQDNQPARRLYDRAGFTHSHTYHYRTQPTG